MITLLNGVTQAGAHSAGAVSNIISLGRLNVNATSSLANGHLCEVVILDRALTDAEMLLLSTYFNTKWAVY